MRGSTDKERWQSASLTIGRFAVSLCACCAIAGCRSLDVSDTAIQMLQAIDWDSEASVQGVTTQLERQVRELRPQVDRPVVLPQPLEGEMFDQWMRRARIVRMMELWCLREAMRDEVEGRSEWRQIVSGSTNRCVAPDMTAMDMDVIEIMTGKKPEHKPPDSESSTKPSHEEHGME